MILQTRHLELRLQSPAETLAWVETLPAEVQAEISPAWRARLQAAVAPDPWICGFVIFRRDTAEAIGSCGFKGPPDESGAVEIAYAIDEPQRGQGYATEAAVALARFATGTAGVAAIRAHTKAENAASERVLRKAKFELLGEYQDPEDGAVNQWEYRPAPLVP